MTAVWLENSDDLPWEYARVMLERDVYHCTPEQLDQQDWLTVQMDLAVLNGEGKGRDALNKRKK